jgi:hypothetical protein
MLVTPRTGWAIGTDARFANLSQRTLNSGPEFFEISQEVLSEGGIKGFGLCHSMYIYKHTYHGNKKMKRTRRAVFPPSLRDYQEPREPQGTY